MMVTKGMNRDSHLWLQLRLLSDCYGYGYGYCYCYGYGGVNSTHPRGRSISGQSFPATASIIPVGIATALHVL